jgi:hypothetical protein
MEHLKLKGLAQLRWFLVRWKGAAAMVKTAAPATGNNTGEHWSRYPKVGQLMPVTRGGSKSIYPEAIRRWVPVDRECGRRGQYRKQTNRPPIAP